MLNPRESEPARALRVLYFGTYRAEYSRNQIMIEGLRRNGVVVNECHESLWHSIDDRVAVASGGWRSPGFWWRVIKAYFRLLGKYARAGDYDVMVVGYPGQFDVYLARLLTWLKRRPLVWDVFMSIYLIAIERGLDHKSPFTMSMLKRFEKKAFDLPDLLVQDTAEYVDWLCRTYHLEVNRFRLVPTGADDRTFFPRIAPSQVADTFQIVYYGTFIPNHGVPVMIEAARMLKAEQGISFLFIGDGPEQAQARQISAGLRNVQFVDWMEKDALVECIAAADLCLGAFGLTPQSLMTVQNKIYECLAMRKAVLSGDSPAMRQSFIPGKHLYLCEREPAALAKAISALYQEPSLCEAMAEQGYNLFCAQYNLQNLGAQYSQHLREIYSGFINNLSQHK